MTILTITVLMNNPTKPVTNNKTMLCNWITILKIQMKCHTKPVATLVTFKITHVSTIKFFDKLHAETTITKNNNNST